MIAGVVGLLTQYFSFEFEPWNIKNNKQHQKVNVTHSLFIEESCWNCGHRSNTK